MLRRRRAARRSQQLTLGAFKMQPTEVIEAKAVEPNADMPAYCQVQGYVSPQVGF